MCFAPGVRQLVRAVPDIQPVNAGVYAERAVYSVSSGMDYIG